MSIVTLDLPGNAPVNTVLACLLNLAADLDCRMTHDPQTLTFKLEPMDGRKRVRAVTRVVMPDSMIVGTA